MGTPSNRYLRISGVDLRTAETLVDASGLPGWFADRAAGCRGNHGGGAPIRFSWRHLLIALALLAMSEQPMILRDAVRTCNALTRKQKTRLGLPARVTERMVSWRFNRLVDLIDPSPHSVRNRTRRAEMTGGQWDAAEEWQQAGLEHVLDRILAASIPDDADESGSYAVDSTGVPSWARQNARWTDPDTATDPDAAWRSHMSTTAPYGQTEGTRPRFGGKAWYGYALHAFVRVPNMEVARDGECTYTDTPSYIERIGVTAANINDAEAGADLLARMTVQTPAAPGDIVMDRAYSQGFDTFLATVRALGYTPHFDLRADQRGVGGDVDGMVIVDGQPYSPSLPENLRNIGAPRIPGATRADLAEWHAQHARRSPWLIRVRGTNPDTGKMDLSCPAARDFSAMRCALKPESVLLPATIPTAPPVADPDAPPKICAQQRLRVDGERLPLWQPHQYGTTTWWKSMNRRALVEGAFGRLKNDATHNLTRGRIRVMGLAKTSIMAAFLAAAANLATTERLHTAAAQPDAAPEPAVKRGPRPRTTRLAARRAQHAARTAARAVLAAAAPPGG